MVKEDKYHSSMKILLRDEIEVGLWFVENGSRRITECHLVAERNLFIGIDGGFKALSKCSSW